MLKYEHHPVYERDGIGSMMSEHLISILLYANLKEKAGTGILHISIPENSTVGDLKKLLKNKFPTLAPQLANVVVLINKHHIFLDADIIPLNAEVTFLPPIAGG